MRVKHGATWHVHRQNLTLKWAGLGMGIGGSVTAFAGLLLTMPIVFSAMCEDPNCVTDGERRARTSVSA